MLKVNRQRLISLLSGAGITLTLMTLSGCNKEEKQPINLNDYTTIWQLPEKDSEGQIIKKELSAYMREILSTKEIFILSKEKNTDAFDGQRTAEVYIAYKEAENYYDILNNKKISVDRYNLESANKYFEFYLDNVTDADFMKAYELVKEVYQEDNKGDVFGFFMLFMGIIGLGLLIMMLILSRDEEMIGCFAILPGIVGVLGIMTGITSLHDRYNVMIEDNSYLTALQTHDTASVISNTVATLIDNNLVIIMDSNKVEDNIFAFEKEENGSLKYIDVNGNEVNLSPTQQVITFGENIGSDISEMEKVKQYFKR